MKATDTSSGLALSLLRELLHYEPETGWFTWKVARSGNICIGDRAGSHNRNTGYREIWIGERRYSSHRLAYFWMVGEWPAETVDHVNLDSLDDRWCNLRHATQADQCANRGLNSRNKSGFKGVSMNSATGQWYASIKVNGKSKNLGHYATAEEASGAYMKAATMAFGDFARAN